MNTASHWQQQRDRKLGSALRNARSRMEPITLIRVIREIRGRVWLSSREKAQESRRGKQRTGEATAVHAVCHWHLASALPVL